MKQKYCLILGILAISGVLVVSGCINNENPPTSLNTTTIPEELNLSTPEKTFDLYIKAIKNEDFELMRKLNTKKQQDLVERKINLMQEAVNKGNVLWKTLFFLDQNQKDFIVKINQEHSGYSNIIGKETYKKLYAIEFNVGSGTYSAYFVIEDGKWVIPGSWDTYQFEE